MFIEDMHYDFKKKFNKIDSNQNKNLLIPEIDWALNEAQKIFIDIVAEPRGKSFLGFERTQKNIDDIKALVVNDQSLKPSEENTEKSIFNLPNEYLYFIRGQAIISKNICKSQKARIYIQQHDDEFELSPFDKSSFEWREVNALFTNKGLKLYTDGTFKIDSILLSYIRQPLYMHNAKDFRGGQYNLPSGKVLKGKQDCELSEQCCREIVDIAVAISSSEIQTNDYQIKYSKLGFNNLK